MRTLKVRKWGSKQIVTIPVELMRAHGWKTGDLMNMEGRPEGIYIWPVEKRISPPDRYYWLEKFEKKYGQN